MSPLFNHWITASGFRQPVVSGPIAAAALGHHHPRLGAAECVETRAPWYCDLHGKIVIFYGKIVIYPLNMVIYYGKMVIYLWKDGDLLWKDGDLTIKHCDLLWKNGDLPMERW